MEDVIVQVLYFKTYRITSEVLAKWYWVYVLITNVGCRSDIKYRL